MALSAAGHVALQLYIDAFSARQDGYVLDSRQHIEPDNEDPEHSVPGLPARTLTPEVIAWAFANKHSVSGYTATFEGDRMMTHIGAIDLDEGGLPEAAVISNILEDHDIPNLVCESRRGFHLWTFHTGTGTHGTVAGGLVPATVVRRALMTAAGLSGLPAHLPREDKVYREQCSVCGLPVHRHPEVFPKASTRPWGVGALRMPLMIHPKTGEKYPVYGFGGARIESSQELIDAVPTMTAPWEKVYALAGGDDAPVAYPSDLGDYRKPTRVVGDMPKITTLLGSMGVEATVGHTVKCPFHPDGKGSLSIAVDDERAFCKAPSCDLYNGGRGMGSLALQSYLRRAKGRSA